MKNYIIDKDTLNCPTIRVVMDRPCDYNPESNIKIKSSGDMANAFRTFSKINNNDLSIQEYFYCAFLNMSNDIISIMFLNSGTICSTVVDVPLICAVALQLRSTNVIICHNHPSGNLKFSNQDISLNKKISQAL